MTDLLSRPILRVEPADEPPSRPLPLSAALAGAGAAVVGVIVCVAVSVIAWFAADTGSFGSAIRVGALSWLLGNGAGLHLGAVSITAIPLGLSLLWSWMLYRGGRWAGGHAAVGSLLDAATGVAAIGGAYCVAAVVVSGVTRTGAAHADLLRTVVGSALLGLLFGGLGVCRGAGMTKEVLEGFPDELRAALTGSAAGVAVMLFASGALLTGSLIQHFSTATMLSEGLHAGLVGGAVMALVGLAAVPNAALCAGAFIAGPGFMLGTGTSVGPTKVALGQLPSFPLLAAVPRGSAGGWVDALIAVPVLAGAVAGVTALRRYPVVGVGPAAARGGVAGLVFGLAFGSLSWLATGAVGPGRMQDVGPDVMGTLAMCVAAGILGGALAASCVQVTSSFWTRRPTPAEGSAASGEASAATVEAEGLGSEPGEEGDQVPVRVQGVELPGAEVGRGDPAQ